MKYNPNISNSNIEKANNNWHTSSECARLRVIPKEFNLFNGSRSNVILNDEVQHRISKYLAAHDDSVWALVTSGLKNIHLYPKVVSGKLQIKLGLGYGIRFETEPKVVHRGVTLTQIEPEVWIDESGYEEIGHEWEVEINKEESKYMWIS